LYRASFMLRNYVIVSCSLSIFVTQSTPLITSQIPENICYFKDVKNSDYNEHIGSKAIQFFSSQCTIWTSLSCSEKCNEEQLILRFNTKVLQKYALDKFSGTWGKVLRQYFGMHLNFFLTQLI